MDEVLSWMCAMPLYGWFLGDFTKLLLSPPPSGEPGYTFSAGVLYPSQETLLENAGDARFWVSELTQLELGDCDVFHLPIACIPASVALSELAQEDYHWLYKIGLVAGGWTSCAWPLGAGVGIDPSRGVPLAVANMLPQTHRCYVAPGAGGAIGVGDLPRFQDITRIFGLSFDRQAPPSAEWAGPQRAALLSELELRDLEQLYAGSLNGGQLRLDMSKFNAAALRKSFRQVTTVWPRSPLNIWALGFRINEVYTQEFVRALATYLKDRLAALGDAAGPIVEVGAGFGVLAQALRSLEVPVVATTLDTKWPMHAEVTLPPHGIQLEDQSETVARLKPSIIFCAWMPPHQDWALGWREQPSVREYILMGSHPSCASLITGTAATWCMSDDQKEVVEPAGWRAHGVPEVSRWCICYADGDYPFSLSTVLSVRRL